MMYQVIKNYCENDSTNGLFLLDMPTGFGKTHSVLEYIFNACMKNKNRRFFFITPLKKNLPINDLRKLFEEEGKVTEFNEKVLFIDSNSESVIENFSDSIEENIPAEITRTEAYKNFLQEIRFLQEFRFSQKQRTAKDSQIQQIVKRINNNFREHTEPAFRKMIEGILEKKYKSVKKRLLAIKTEKDWKWVGELYPAVFTRDKQIFFMSMDKFLSKNATIIEPSYQFYNNKIIDNAIIFIDEFDATKETTLKNIIQNGLRDKIDVIKLFCSIYSIMTMKDFPAELTERRKDSKYSKKYLKKILDDTKKMARDICKTYSLQFSHRTAAEIDKSQKNFLFQDHQSHPILNGNNKFITSVSNKKDKINIINFTPEVPEIEAQNIHVMLGKLRGFIKWFQKMVNILATNYCQRENGSLKDGEYEITQEQAMRSVLSLFNLGEYEKDYLTKQVITTPREAKDEQAEGSEFDLTVYEHGFRYYCFENDVTHNMQSKIMMYSFPNTPEKLLLCFCERAKVIGISATTTVPTVLGNFDLDYLRRKLQSAYYEIPESEHERLKQEFHNSQEGYNNIRIHAELIGTSDYSLRTWLSIFDDEELAECVYDRLEIGNNKYIKERYFRIAKAFKSFLEHDDIKSMLCLLTKHPANNDAMLSKELIEYILDLVTKVHPDPKNQYIEYLRSEDYDTQKDALLTRLSNGEKIFVISTYQTIGTGQNLQYKIPPELQGKLIHSNNYPPRDEKDFDAIYLDKPTNLLVNMEQDWPGESFIKYLFQVEFLQENLELSMAETNQHVRKAFECYTTGSRPNNSFAPNMYDKKSVRTYATKAVVQAIGRICRTNQKNPDIYIFADDRIADYLDLSITQDRILNHEFTALIRKIEGTQTETPDSDELKNGANLVSTRAGKDIDKLLNGNWTKGTMKKWQDLRQLVLKFPTVSKDEAEGNFIFSNYYVKLKEKSNVLYYTQENDFRNINVSFEHKKPRGFLVEDKSGTRLDRLMQWGALRDYFLVQGYATDFVPNDYIMSPSIWHNIYKGALGEAAGKFWFESVLNTTLEDISEPEKFELFDFRIPGKDVYVDFKNWNESNEMNWYEMVDKIKIKANKCGCKCAIIANIIAKSKHTVQQFYEGNIKFLVIPSLLLDNEGISIDYDAVAAIRRCLNEFTDKN